MRVVDVFVSGVREDRAAMLLQTGDFVGGCNLSHCNIRVEPGARLMSCRLDDCDTVVERGALATRNSIVGGSWRDDNAGDLNNYTLDSKEVSS